MGTTSGFMLSYKRLSSVRERKILEILKKSKNTVKRTLGLCTVLYAIVRACLYDNQHCHIYIYIYIYLSFVKDDGTLFIFNFIFSRLLVIF